MTSDRDMLQALLDYPKLRDDERQAFGDMLDKMVEFKALTEPQRNWVKSRFVQLELDSGESLNLASSGSVPTGDSKVKLLIHDMPKPLKPPGRR